MSVMELARKYYPQLWGAQRIESLVSAGKLTREEADEILGCDTDSKAVR